MGKKRRLERGFVHVYTGNGKGKTTAAIGLAVRAAGGGLRVFMAQFLKAAKCSELRSLARLGRCITVRQFGSGRFVKECPSRKDIEFAAKGLDASRKAVLSGKYDLVILDELCCAISLKIIDIRLVQMLLAGKPKEVEIVLTGRNAPPAIIKMADLVTEMKEVRHYYSSGVVARRGIEY